MCKQLSACAVYVSTQTSTHEFSSVYIFPFTLIPQTQFPSSFFSCHIPAAGSALQQVQSGHSFLRRPGILEFSGERVVEMLLKWEPVPGVHRTRFKNRDEVVFIQSRKDLGARTAACQSLYTKTHCYVDTLLAVLKSKLLTHLLVGSTITLVLCVFTREEYHVTCPMLAWHIQSCGCALKSITINKVYLKDTILKCRDIH